ncbi:MAG: FKBP-type peptidyl-prolyl cis-trans isomerase [Patescibacteria group bacterium]|nr:FKBP-type peptidyl-prolyl cis-trans isomerase [Patescibacteria group bacterium]
MALKRERFFALFFAILFLITSSALTIAFIWSNYQNGKNNNTVASNQSNLNQVSKLVGTKLANFTPISSVTTPKSIDLKVGNGPVVKAGATVEVNYTGALASTGIIFQSSLGTGQPVTFNLKQVILGWTLGIPGMRVGGTRRLILPANLAYGANPPPGSGIPPNAPLVFDVSLLSIIKNN